MEDGAKIRAAREAAGMSQGDLAAASGVRQPNIAAYETGRRRPSPQMVDRLLQAARGRPSLVLAEHRDRVLDLAREHHAAHVRVIGSVARGDDHPGSDIDLLVRFDPDATIFDQAGLIDALTDLLGRSVDVISDRALKPRDTAIRRQAVPL